MSDALVHLLQPSLLQHAKLVGRSRSSSANATLRHQNGNALDTRKWRIQEDLLRGGTTF